MKTLNKLSITAATILALAAPVAAQTGIGTGTNKAGNVPVTADGATSGNTPAGVIPGGTGDTDSTTRSIGEGTNQAGNVPTDPKPGELGGTDYPSLAGLSLISSDGAKLGTITEASMAGNGEVRALVEVDGDLMKAGRTVVVKVPKDGAASGALSVDMTRAEFVSMIPAQGSMSAGTGG